MELLKQAVIAERRGEINFSDVLLEFVAEEQSRMKEIETARLMAENVVFFDEDR